MYIFKYALKSVSRSIGRNILIGIIVLLIAVSSCVAMSIQRASKVASEESLKGMSVSAHIYVDRQYIMSNFSAEQGGDVDFKEVLSELKGLDLDEMKHYAGASSVDDFYYSSSLSMDSKTLTALSANDTQTSAPSQNASMQPQGENQGGMMPGMQQDPDAMLSQMVNQGDFNLEGYVSDAAMEDFADGICYITDGKMFEENTSEYKCIITEELATYNSISVGDTIKLCNPNNTDERYSFKVTGVYKNTAMNSSTVMSASNDPANTIITSYAAVEKIEEKSDKLNKSDEETTLKGTVEGTYVFDSVSNYDLFEKEVVELGLEEKYTVASNDIATYEASLIPLENLKTFATTFLYVTLFIGAVVLIVISIISIRDRKYEIGALAAMGLKKFKLSTMFIIETLTVTLIAIILGSIIGSAASVPITNALLESQVEQQITEDSELKDNFGRVTSTATSKPRGGDVEGEVEYVSSISFSVDYLVILKMILIGIGLSVVSGFTSILFILRYDPKEILANRD